MDGRLLGDAVIRESAAFIELLARKDEALDELRSHYYHHLPFYQIKRELYLLLRGNALLVLDLLLHQIDRIRGLDVERDRLARQRLHKDLHGRFSRCTNE